MSNRFSSLTLRSTLVLSLAATSAAAQSLLATHGEVLCASSDPVPGIAGAIFDSSSSAFDSAAMDQDGNTIFRGRFEIGPGGVTGLDNRGYLYGRNKDDLQLILRSNDQAPGLPAGTLLRTNSATGSFAMESDPVISPTGGILYFGSRFYDPVTPANTPTTSDSGFFWGPPGGILNVAREGTQVPFLPVGVTYGSLSFSRQYHGINSAGQIILTCGLGGAATTDNDAVMATGLPGSLEVIIREGDMVGSDVIIPASGSTMSFKSQINELGQVLHEMRFSTTLGTATDTTDRALAIFTPGSGSTIIAREGDQAAGFPAGVTYNRNNNTSWTADSGSNSFTRGGNTAFITYIDGAGVTVDVDDRVIYYVDNQVPIPFVRRGDDAGFGDSSTFNVFGSSSLSCTDSGTLSFISSLAGPSVTADNDTAMFYGTLGNWTALGREGDLAPMAPASPNGPWVISQIQQGTLTPHINADGQVLFQLRCFDSVNSENFMYLYNPDIGLQLLIDGTETFTTTTGTGTITSYSNAGSFNSGDNSTYWMNTSGDFAFKAGIDNGLGAAMVRGHAGSMIAAPAVVSAAGGQAHNFTVDCGVANAGNLYLVVTSGSGSRPGTPSPLGPATIPLNLDAWFDISLAFANTPIYTNTLGLLDANGQIAGGASFTLPPGVPGLAGSQLHHAVVVFDGAFVNTYATEAGTVKFL